MNPRVEQAEDVIVGAGKRDEFSRFCVETLRKFPEPQAGSSTLTPAISSAKRHRRLLRPLLILFARPPPASSLLPASFSACSLTSAHLLQTLHQITKAQVHLRYDRRLKLLTMGPIEHHVVSSSCQPR